MAERNRVLFVDYLRCFAIILVVLHHMPYSNDNVFIIKACEFGLYFIEKAGVPIFLMISGYLLLPLKDSIKNFFLKRIIRVVTPFIVFSYIYSFFHFFVQNDKVFSLTNLLFPFFVRSEHHLWYVYMLLSIYLIIPFLSDFYSKRKLSDILIYISLWCGIMLLMWFVPSDLDFGLYKRVDMVYPLYIFYYVSGYVGYFWLGAVLKKIHQTSWYVNIGTRRMALYLMAIFVLYVSLSVYGIMILDIPYSSVNTYLTFPCFLLSTFIFECFYRFLSDLERMSLLHKCIVSISKCSYGIYLIHILVINTIVFFLDKIEPNYLFNKMSFGIVTLILSFIIVNCISKMPYGKYIVG